MKKTIGFLLFAVPGIAVVSAPFLVDWELGLPILLLAALCAFVMWKGLRMWRTGASKP